MENLIHPDFDLTVSNIGAGNYIQESLHIVETISIHTGALMGPGASIESPGIISHGATASKHCRIDDECFIGINATVLPHASIGRNASIDAGKIAKREILDNSLALSNFPILITNKRPLSTLWMSLVLCKYRPLHCRH